jgi:hypothetical protein
LALASFEPTIICFVGVGDYLFTMPPGFRSGKSWSKLGRLGAETFFEHFTQTSFLRRALQFPEFYFKNPALEPILRLQH